MNLKIFFSHAWNDKAGSKVKKLLVFLQKDYDVWLDKTSITPGDHINYKVAEGIEACDVFVNVWSKNAHSSQGVLFELQTAAGLKKPIIVLLIENYPVTHSAHLEGREYFDFSGDEVSFNQQLVYLQNFLLQKKIAVLEQHCTSPEDLSVLTDLKKKHVTLYSTLIELEDTIKRQQMKESGNDHSHVYIESSFNAFEKTLETETEDGKLLMHFSAAMKEISEKYPQKKDDQLKKQLALEAIEKLDPHERNQQLKALKLAFRSDLGQQKPMAAEPAVAQSIALVPLRQEERELVGFYKNSVEKTRQHILEKSKTSSGSAPLLKFIASVHSASTDIEMQYITNSPGTLEKMYEAALASGNNELQSLVSVLIRHIKVADIQQAEASQKITAYMPYAYLINNTARLLVQAKAIAPTEVSYHLISNFGLDKISKFFFKEEWKDKAEKFLELVKNNYGIKDKNLNWLKTAAAIVGVIVAADLLTDGAGASLADTGSAGMATSGSGPVFFEDKMASMGFSIPNTVQW